MFVTETMSRRLCHDVPGVVRNRTDENVRGVEFTNFGVIVEKLAKSLCNAYCWIGWIGGPGSLP